MRLLSKDATLEESLAKMQEVLAKVGCEPTLSEEKHPLQNCFSVNLASKEAPRHIYSNGKGVLSEASMASAYGEFIERLQTNNFFIDFYLPQRKYYPDEVAFAFDEEYLAPELASLYDSEGELSPEDFVDFNSDYEDKIVALPFKKRDGERLYIPLNVLSTLYVSNGLATGNTPQEAQVQALSEIFERHVKFEVIKNGYALPAFGEELVASFPRVHKDVVALRGLGYVVEVLDASLGGVFPVTAISFINPKNATLFVSFGAHPILEVSLERTMTELMQGRSLENLDAFEVPTFDMSLVSQSFNLEAHFIDSNGKMGLAFLGKTKSFAVAPWGYEGTSTEDEHRYLNAILDALKKESFIREYAYLGFYSCQMIVPTLSEVYPLDDLIYANKNSGKRLRDMVLNFSSYDPEDILVEIEALEETINVEKYIGVIFENNFTLREFKAQTFMAFDEMEQALELLEYGSDSFGHLVVEMARMEELGIDFFEYEEALYALHSKERVMRALRVLEGEALLCDTTFHEDYKGMLALYDKLERTKINLKI